MIAYVKLFQIYQGFNDEILWIKYGYILHIKWGGSHGAEAEYFFSNPKTWFCGLGQRKMAVP